MVKTIDLIQNEINYLMYFVKDTYCLQNHYIENIELDYPESLTKYLSQCFKIDKNNKIKDHNKKNREKIITFYKSCIEELDHDELIYKIKILIMRLESIHRALENIINVK